jgi:hypothetical protein
VTTQINVLNEGSLAKSLPGIIKTLSIAQFFNRCYFPYFEFVGAGSGTSFSCSLSSFFRFQMDSFSFPFLRGTLGQSSIVTFVKKGERRASILSTL